MKKIIIAALTVLMPLASALSQEVEGIIAEIEQNNTTLEALRKEADASLISNKTGIYIQNPEVAFDYLWGDPASIGNRKDISVMQTIDFPSAYLHRNAISSIRNRQVELEFRKQRTEILTHARLVYADLVYQNALLSSLIKRQADAGILAGAYRQAFENGEKGVMEYNRAQMNYLNLSRTVEEASTQRKILLQELQTLNGGRVIDVKSDSFEQVTLPADFEQWYIEAEKLNPVLAWLREDISLGERGEKLSTSLSLPRLQAGYMSEEVVGQKYQGISVGISVPLFENKNSVRYAKARSLAAREAEADAKIQFYSNMKSLFIQTSDLIAAVETYRAGLRQTDNSLLLRTALENGEISLGEYILELSLYYENADRLLEMERELHSSFIRLNKYSMD